MPFNANNEWIPEDDSVATRVASITQADSPLMRQATGMGLRQANRRGMVNSSIAAGAARAAQLSAAVPIASQDAQTVAQKNIARIGGDYDMSKTRMTLASAERDNAAARMSDAFSNYSANMANIAANPKLKASARTSMQQSALDQMNAQLAAFRNLYLNQNLSW